VVRLRRGPVGIGAAGRTGAWPEGFFEGVVKCMNPYGQERLGFRELLSVKDNG
jgi:hypothetical protein